MIPLPPRHLGGPQIRRYGTLSLVLTVTKTHSDIGTCQASVMPCRLNRAPEVDGVPNRGCVLAAPGRWSEEIMADADAR